GGPAGGTGCRRTRPNDRSPRTAPWGAGRGSGPPGNRPRPSPPERSVRRCGTRSSRAATTRTRPERPAGCTRRGRAAGATAPPRRWDLRAGSAGTGSTSGARRDDTRPPTRPTRSGSAAEDVGHLGVLEELQLLWRARHHRSAHAGVLGQLADGYLGERVVLGHQLLDPGDRVVAVLQLARCARIVGSVVAALVVAGHNDAAAHPV